MTNPEGTSHPPHLDQLFCPSCRGGNPPGAAACGWCGKELPRPPALTMPVGQAQPPPHGYPQQVPPPPYPPQYGQQYPYPPPQQMQPAATFPAKTCALVAGLAVLLLV